jgi:hypothetical protein
MKFLEKIVGVIPKYKLEIALTEVIASSEHLRNDIRKKAFEELDKLDPIKQGERVAEVLTRMNSELTSSYEKEIAIRDFIGKLK